MAARRRLIAVAVAAASVLFAPVGATASSAAKGALPTVTSVSPNVGLVGGGDAINVEGDNFGSSPTFLFGGVRATVLQHTTGTAIVRSPKHAAGTVHITVVTAVGSSAGTAKDHFRYRATPTPVTGLRSSLVDGYQAHLSWTPSTTENQYRIIVYRRHSASAPRTLQSTGKIVAQLAPSTTEWTDTETTWNSTWSYSLFVVVEGGYYDSPPASVVVKTLEPYRPGTLPEPTDLAVDPIAGTVGPSGRCGQAYCDLWMKHTSTYTLSAHTHNNWDDSSPVALRFTVWFVRGQYDEVQLYPDNDPATLSKPIPAGGGTGTVRLDASALPDGGQIEFVASTVHTDGTPPQDTSTYPGQISDFGYDDSAPPAPTSITSTDFPADGSGLLHTGQPGSFTASGGDAGGQYGGSGTGHFVYSFDRADILAGRGTSVPLPELSMPATSVTFDATPPRSGYNQLWVAVVDQAGNIGTPGAYDFLVTAPPTEPRISPGAFPHASDSYDTLGTVSCPTTSRCVAFGFTGGEGSPGDHLHHEVSEPLVQTWTPGGASGVWTPTILAGPPDVTYYGQAPIDCADPDTCTAVMTYSTAAPGSLRMMAASLSGGAWRLTDVPLPTGATSGTDDRSVLRLGHRVRTHR